MNTYTLEFLSKPAASKFIAWIKRDAKKIRNHDYHEYHNYEADQRIAAAEENARRSGAVVTIDCASLNDANDILDRYSLTTGNLAIVNIDKQ